MRLRASHRFLAASVLLLATALVAVAVVTAGPDDKGSDVPPLTSEPPRLPAAATENRPIPLSATPDRANIPPDARQPVEPPTRPELPLTDENGNRLLRAGMVTESGSYRLAGSDSNFAIEIPEGAPAFTVHTVLQEGDPSDPDYGDGVTWVFVNEAVEVSIAFWVTTGNEAFRYLAPGVDPELSETFDQMADSVRKVE